MRPLALLIVIVLGVFMLVDMRNRMHARPKAQAEELEAFIFETRGVDTAAINHTHNSSATL